MEYLILILLSALAFFVMYTIYKNRNRNIESEPVEPYTPHPPQEGPYQWVYYDHNAFQEDSSRYNECPYDPPPPKKECNIDMLGDIEEVEPCSMGKNIVANPYWKCEEVD